MSGARDLRGIRVAALALTAVVALGAALLLARALRAAAAEERLVHGEAGRRVIAEFERRLTALVAREEARPFAQWRHVAVPEGAVLGSLALSLSPLAAPPAETGIVGWFQIEPDGSFSTPHRPHGSERELAPMWCETADLAARIAVVEAATAALRPAASSVAARAPAPAVPVAAPVPIVADLVTAPTAPVEPMGNRYQEVGDIDQRLNSFSSRAERPSLQQVRASASQVYNFTQGGLDNELQRSVVANGSLPPSVPPADPVAPPAVVTTPPPAPVATRLRADEAVVQALAMPAGAEVDVEISRLARLARDGDRVVLGRRVRVAGRAWTQGLVIDLPALAARLGEEVLGADADGLAFAWSVGDVVPPTGDAAPPPGWDVALPHRCEAPFADLHGRLLMRRLAGADGARAVAWWLAAGLVVAATLGIAALYRSATVVLAYARRRADFTAAVSHELKTPLTAIRLHAELLRDGLLPDGERRAASLGTIVAESERLSRLVGNVLALARLERGEHAPTVVVGDPGEALAEAAAVVEPHARAAGYAIAVVRQPGPAARFDRDALLQAVINLVDNALKFGRDARERAIELECLPAAGGGVAVRVADHGPGVPAEDLARIFEPFWRGERELTRTTTGTGIGLALVRGLVERMGGRVRAWNRDGGGLVVEMVLPDA